MMLTKAANARLRLLPRVCGAHILDPSCVDAHFF
jgi:hypothetical protein